MLTCVSNSHICVKKTASTTSELFFTGLTDNAALQSPSI